MGYDDLANRGVGAARSAEGCEAGELVVERGAGSVGPSYVVLIETLAHDRHAGVRQVAFRTAGRANDVANESPAVENTCPRRALIAARRISS